MRRSRNIILGTLLLIIAFAASGDYLSFTGGEFRTAREADRNDAPTWPINPDFKKDTFVFARVQYVAIPEKYGPGHTEKENRWLIDFPLSDLDLSFRLHQMTSLNVDPDCRVVKIKDKELFDFPFLYIVEPGRGLFTDEEAVILRKYLLNGGFLMLDDFWGNREWEACYHEIKRVFPDREPVDLPLEHPIFHTVFNLQEKPQVPGIDHAKMGRTHERGQEGAEVHYRGIFDDKNRLMVLLCHNTDLGDGWEREGANEEYFRQYSEPKAFPMGINAIVYAMTH